MDNSLQMVNMDLLRVQQAVAVEEVSGSIVKISVATVLYQPTEVMAHQMLAEEVQVEG